MSNDDLSITTLSARTMAGDLARATQRLWQLRRADFPNELEYYTALEQQLDVADYWFGVLAQDAEKSGWLLRTLIARTADAVDLTVQLVQLWRQHTALMQAQAAAGETV